MAAFLLAAGVMFVAELGDKSQLLALAFATRYRPRQVLAGIALGALIVLGVFAGLGSVLGELLAPHRDTVTVVAGLLFLVFAGWTLLARDEDHEPEPTARGGVAVLVVAGTFMVSELGDKTMLATVTLATQEGWVPTWLGATTGLVVADAIAIGVGTLLGRRLPRRVLRWLAAAAFAVVGVVAVVRGLTG